mmetsp:Transcript_5279/g.9116  ORF Transcript_5279/g.9116 Transcript_5279/m.9116 type:complete len:212 (-) Transcript_5279:151-786(-)
MRRGGEDVVEEGKGLVGGSLQFVHGGALKDGLEHVVDEVEGQHLQVARKLIRGRSPVARRRRDPDAVHHGHHQLADRQSILAAGGQGPGVVAEALHSGAVEQVQEHLRGAHHHVRVHRRTVQAVTVLTDPDNFTVANGLNEAGVEGWIRVKLGGREHVHDEGQSAALLGGWYNRDGGRDLGVPHVCLGERLPADELGQIRRRSLHLEGDAG